MMRSMGFMDNMDTQKTHLRGCVHFVHKERPKDFAGADQYNMEEPQRRSRSCLKRRARRADRRIVGWPED